MPDRALWEVVDALTCVRIAAGGVSEAEIVAEIHKTLLLHGIRAYREVKIGPRSRIDFLYCAVGIEVKRGRPLAPLVMAQLRRYAKSAAIEALVLVAERCPPLPETLGGKRLVGIGLSRNWGVAV